MDLPGNTVDFMLSAKRDLKALSSNHNQISKVITVDKNPAYLTAIG
jgi:transposase-like protein